MGDGRIQPKSEPDRWARRLNSPQGVEDPRLIMSKTADFEWVRDPSNPGLLLKSTPPVPLNRPAGILRVLWGVFLRAIGHPGRSRADKDGGAAGPAVKNHRSSHARPF
jgi:hypothetical protein